MNLQIFGKTKCFETKKAQRYFKERGLKFQFVDIARFGISPGEYQSIKKAVGGMRALIDEGSKEYENLGLKYLASESDAEALLLENPGMFKTPIARNGKEATVGFKPEAWSAWA
ncbi:MAG: arsenate reductase family protein [Actinomycetia bacterium]|nr:arsenate reductase family protein [Actinomycetes bacterium]